MCGIVGAIDLHSKRTLPTHILSAMCKALTHRGPDGEGLEALRRARTPGSRLVRPLSDELQNGGVGVGLVEPDGRPWFVRIETSGALGFPTSIASDDHGRFQFPMEFGAQMTVWVSPLNASPGVPRSGLNARVPEPFPVRDLTVGTAELVIQVP